MLSKEIREALEAELEHLKLRRRQITERIDVKIKAIEALIAPADDDPAHGQQRLHLGGSSKAANGNGGPLAGKGLREAMKTILVNYPGGLRPADLTAKLEAQGVEYTGKLPLKTRVWSEIARLRKEGRMTKRGKRVLWIIPKEPPAGPEIEGEASSGMR